MGILVLGAGELGLAILEALSQANTVSDSKLDLTVLLHPRPCPDSDPSRQRLLSHLNGRGISTIYADITSPDLHIHLQGYDIVISATGFSAGSTAITSSGSGTQRHICRAALEAGVPWFFPWQFGVDYDVIGKGSAQPVFDEQLDVREMLRNQSEQLEGEQTRWTIVSTGIFTSFLFDQAFGVVEIEGMDMDEDGHRDHEQGMIPSVTEGTVKAGAARSENSADKQQGSRGRVTVTALGDWNNRITMTSAKDIGRITTQYILRNQITGDRNEKQLQRASGVIYTAGSTITFSELASGLEQQGWQVLRQLKTVQELERAIDENPADVGAKYQLIWARNYGVAWNVEESWNSQVGMEVEGVEDWIKENFHQ